MSTDRPGYGPDGTYQEDLEAARSAWSRLEQIEPPDLLDQAVLNAARRAAARPSRRRSTRWLGALASAAVVVLALTLVIRQDPQAPAPPVPVTDGFELELRSADPEAAHETPIQHEEAAPQAASKAALVPRQDAASREEAGAPVAAPDALEEMDEAVPEPDAWVDQMLRLKAAGLNDQLDQELAAFRRSYPDFVLPPELLE
jgi:ferric-dicitrate binding protein FerR (iron transport regulator)